MAENAPDRSRAPPSSVPERNEKRTRKANLIPRRAWPQRGWTPESREARSSPLLAPHELSALFSPVASSASIQRHPGGIDALLATGENRADSSCGARRGVERASLDSGVQPIWGHARRGIRFAFRVRFSFRSGTDDGGARDLSGAFSAIRAVGPPLRHVGVQRYRR